jgi:hypothetical protein
MFFTVLQNQSRKGQHHFGGTGAVGATSRYGSGSTKMLRPLAAPKFIIIFISGRQMHTYKLSGLKLFFC